MPRLVYAIGAAAAAAALALSTAVTTALPATAAAAEQPSTTHATYYLALGDSLSVGDQPNAKGVTLPTSHGYADQLYATLHKTDASLHFYKLGCPGETSATMNKGGVCGYKGDDRYSLTARKGNQLAAALDFIQRHRGQVTLITLDIGANDLNGCIALGSIPKIENCVPPVFAAIEKNLAATLEALRAAAPKATIAGMTYYDPELVAWLTGKSGQTFAQGSVALAGVFGEILTGVYEKLGALVADMFTSFDTTDITQLVNVPGHGKLPKDVAVICKWTFECTRPPIGPDEHGTNQGYGAMSSTFLATLRKAGFKA
jgi:lysophospholipase L1-like esterase